MSLRNVVKRREHKERSQPHERRRLGLLEKHKDYVKRARDHNKKKQRIQALQRKAAFRNPDEYYFHMNNAHTEDGVHISENNHEKELPAAVLKNLKTQDLAYLQVARATDLRKADKLTQGLHFIDAVKDNKHTIFVDDKEDVTHFDPAEHFETVPELVDRPSNRIRKQTLKEDSILKGTKSAKWKKARDRQYREMSDRLNRADKLGRMSAKLDLERKVQSKGKKRKVKNAENGLPAVYKWKRQRQK